MATLMDKYFNVRIKLRNDSWTNWEEKKDLIPYDGEVIIYDIPTQEEAKTYGLGSLNYQLIKIGDGVKTLKQLPAINELSSTLNNIVTGSKKGTISVDGQDIYVKGLNDNTIMCFELKDNYVTSIKLDEKYTTLNNDLTTERDARVQQDNLINENISEINKRIDNLSLPDGSVGKVELKETDDGYTLLQDSITIGSITFPEDNFLIGGEAIKEGNASKINLFTKDDNPISIDITNLINTYKAEQLGERIQLNIDSNNIISADIVEKSLTFLQIANDTIIEDNLSPELKIKINSSGGEGSDITNEQLNILKQYIDDSVNLKTSAILSDAKEYADTIKSELLDGADIAHDTLKELGNLIDKNTGALATLKVSKGNSHQPVYFSNGVPQPIDYTILSNVPADAKFTDTTYSEATSLKAGLMTPEMVVKLNSLSSTDGLVTSVNGKTGDVNLSYADVEAAPAEHTHNYASSSSPGGAAYFASGLGNSASAFTASINNTVILSAIINNKQQWAIERQSATENGILVHYYDVDGKWTTQKRLWQEGDLITGAVWNDYAEFRSQNEEIEPGYVTYCDDDGKLKITTERLQKFEGVVSDTFGFSIGKTNENKTPLAVSGRVLVYGDLEEHFHSGDCVCAGPKGKVYKMTREEIIEFPDRIVGIVSEIPTYEIWGSANVIVDKRIWIKVK